MKLTISAASAQPSSFSFTQGFLLGQLTITLLIGFFIKFFIFGDPPPADVRADSRLQARQARLSSHRRTASNSFAALRRKRSSVLRQPAQSLNPATILEKTYYNVSGHQPESLDWFNVLIAQTIAQLRADARQDDAVLGTLQGALNGDSRPEWLDEVRISEVALGDEFPIFSNCRIIPVDDGLGDGYLAAPGQGRGPFRVGEGTRLQARMDVDLSDVITLGVETKLVLNYPRPFSAVLPVALSVSIVRFSGTVRIYDTLVPSVIAKWLQLSLSFVPSLTPASTPAANSPSPSPLPAHDSPQKSYHPPTSLTFTFLPDYRLDLSVRSLIGSRARLTDVPKIAQLIEDRIHAWFDERVVEPRFQQIILPSLWPRKKTARGPEKEDEDGSTVAEGSNVGPLDDEGFVDGVVDGDGTVEPALYDSADDSMEARLWRDGRRLREDERSKRSGSQRRRPQLSKGSTGSQPPADGVRRRVPNYSERDGSKDGSRMMPGALPP
jgi:maintenance of mitochondrial morphology protein 1